jgi:hypothetical protein
MASTSRLFWVEVEGLNELRAQIRRVEKVPKRAISKSAREGMKNPLADARANAPVGKTNTSGTLKRSIKSIMEPATKRKKYKTVYRLVFDEKYASIFKGKQIKRPGLYGASPPKDFGYYPLSQEYGYKTKYGYKPGRYFIRGAIERNEKNTLQKIIDTLSDEIDKLIQ